MSGDRPFWGAAVTAALLVCAGLLPATAQGRTQSGTLPSGVRYTIAADSAQPVAAASLWYRAPNGGFEDTPLTGLSRLAAFTVAASTPVTGTPLGQLVKRSGGRITVAAYPDTIAITAVVPPDALGPVLRALSGDFFAPVVDAKGLAVAKRDVADELLYRSVDPAEVLEDALGSALFSAGPLHVGALGTATGLRSADLARVRSFAERAFRPANAVLVLSGAVDAGAVEHVAERPSAVATAETPAPNTPRGSPPSLALTGNVGGTGLGWVGPPIADEAAATALDFLADAYFAPRTGIVSKALGTRDAVATGKFVTYHDPGIFLVTVSGDDAAAAVPIVQQALAGAAKPMAPDAFAAARSAFTYDILGSSATAADVAETLGWYAIEGDEAYAPLWADAGAGRYVELVRGLTPQSVARTAARYLTVPPAVVRMTEAKPQPRPEGNVHA